MGKLLLYSALFVMAVLVVLSFGLNMLPVQAPPPAATPTVAAPVFIGNPGDNTTDTWVSTPPDKPKETTFPGVSPPLAETAGPNVYTPPNYRVNESCPGATAICWDGTCSYSHSRSGTCSWHGGVRIWLTKPWN